MLKERAASAIKHGLPVPTPPPSRARVPDPLSFGASASPSGSPELAPPDRRMPLVVKLLGGGLLLLGVVYALTLFRDQRREADAQAPAETDTPLVAATPASVPAPAASESPSNAPREPTPVNTAKASLAVSRASVDPSLLGAALRVPSARPPQPAPVAAKPTKFAPIAGKISHGAIVSMGSPVAPSNAAPSAAPAAVPVTPAAVPVTPAKPAPAE